MRNYSGYMPVLTGSGSALGIPSVRLAARSREPGIQRVVDHEAVTQHLVVIRIQLRET